MTRDDRNPREVPSWVDEVLSAQSSPPPTPPSAPAPTPEVPTSEASLSEVTVASVAPAPAPRPASGPGDLRIPETGQTRPAPTPLTPPDQTAAARPAPQSTSQAAPTLLDSADDWIARATGGTARSPSVPPVSPFQTDAVTHAPVPAHQPDPWAMGQSGPSSTAPVPGDVATRRLIAGLLGIVLGSFGVHKLYLGITTPGLIMLGVNVGVWIVALLLGLLTFGFGLVITLPLAGLVSGAVGLLGLVEGILYLTKSDADFYQQYVVEKKPWL